MAMYIHSADMSSSESCGVHDEKFSGIVPHPGFSVKELQFIAKSLAVVAPHEYQESLRTCGNDDSSNYNDSASRAAVRQLLKRTASRWAGVRGEPGCAALSWLVYRMLVDINLKESHKGTTEEEEVMSIMADSEQAVVVHHHHSVPSNLLDCQTPILQKGGGCITPRKEEEKKITEEDSIDRHKTTTIPLSSRSDVYPPELAAAPTGTMAAIDTTNNNNATTVKLQQQKIHSLLRKLRESKIRRNELEQKTVLLKERVRFHHSEGLKLENWHASRMVARKAITNGKIQLAMSTLENECAQAEMELKAAVTTSVKWKEKVDISNLTTMKIEEAMQSYLKKENDYSIFRRGLNDEFPSRRGQDFLNYDLKLSTFPPRVRMKVGW